METNATIEKMLDEHPLIAFSFYTEVQAKVVLALGGDALGCLEAAMLSPPGETDGLRLDGQTVNKAYGMFWLWVLGAYEIVRTMCQAKNCFSARTADELSDLKRNLGLLRMPFAKQELPGKNKPVNAEPSIYDIQHSPADFFFEVNGQVISARELISGFDAVISGISRQDVLDGMRSAYRS